jgi:hypothetical protein
MEVRQIGVKGILKWLQKSRGPGKEDGARVGAWVLVLDISLSRMIMPHIHVVQDSPPPTLDIRIKPTQILG